MKLGQHTQVKCQQTERSRASCVRSLSVVLSLCLSFGSPGSVASGASTAENNASPGKAMSIEPATQPTKTLWQTKLSVQEADFIEFVSQDRLLVGTIDDSDLGGGLKPHELMLLNSVTGEAIWTVPRGSYGAPQSILAVSPVIIIEGTKQYVALNPDNGSFIWSHERAGESSLLLASRDSIVFLAHKNPPLTLTALNLKTGAELWKTPVENYPLEKGLRVGMTTMGGSVLLTGPEVAAFSASDGKLLWRMPFPTTFSSKAEAIPLGDDLYFWDGSLLTRADPASGKEVWHQPINEGAFETLTESDQAIFVVEKSGAEKLPDSIAALDRNSGKQLWKSDLLDRAASPVSIVGDCLYVTTPDNVIALKTADGSVLFKSEIPSSLQSRKQLPDHLRIIGDRIIVAREEGVLAMQKSDGKLLFADQVTGGLGFTYDYAANRFRHATMNTAPRSKKHPLKATPDSENPDVNYRVAMGQQRLAYEQSRAFYQYQASMTNVILFNTSQPTYQQQQAAQGLAMAGAAIGAGMAVAAALNAVWVARRLSSYQARVQHAFQTHSASLQDRYYLRPTYVQHQGWSLHVVNIETGERGNILLSTDADVTPNGFLANLPAFSTDGTRIVSKGLGANPERITKKRGLWFHDEVAFPSVLAFDPASIRFEPCPGVPAPAAKPVESTADMPDDDLLAAAYRNNLESAKKALDSGANVNAETEYGLTPLMLAAEASAGSKNADVVKLLLQRGADPNVRDPGGLTALEHANLLAAVSSKGMLTAIKLISKAEKNEK